MLDQLIKFRLLKATTRQADLQLAESQQHYPYLAGTAKVPLPYSAHPASHHDYPLTMEEALTINNDVSWLPHPWYHKETQPGSTPMPLLHCTICIYCNNIAHPLAACPNPHHLCPDHLSCIIPSYHTNFGEYCPADPHHHLLDYLINSLSEANHDEEVPY
jgi:hypothetical protein